MCFEELYAYEKDVYRTAPSRPDWCSRTFPSWNFYPKFWWHVIRSSGKARRGRYDGRQWSISSYRVAQALESVGVRLEIAGLQNVRDLDTPCVFVANHMSMLETIILPSIIRPVCPVTFVVKQNLLDYPVFRHVLRSRDPIAVSRRDPRADLKAVIGGGIERIRKGISIVVFPQTTRSETFDPSQFNTIGVKLAQKANVPIVPTALVTDAWGNGRRLKDLGPIDPSKIVRFAFGNPIDAQDRGSHPHQQVIAFIERHVGKWRAEDEMRLQVESANG